MNTTPEYNILITVLSILSLVLFAFHLERVIGVYQHHHDERSAVMLVKAIGLLVISSGMTISSVGLLLDDSQFSIVGLSISRGALIMVAMTLVFADVRKSIAYPSPDPTAATTVTDERSHGILPSVGTDTEYARQDHTHGSSPERNKE